MKHIILLFVMLAFAGLSDAQLLESNRKEEVTTPVGYPAPVTPMIRIEFDVQEPTQIPNFGYLNYGGTMPSGTKADTLGFNKKTVEVQREVLKLRKEILINALTDNKKVLIANQKTLDDAWTKYEDQGNKLNELKDLRIQHFADSTARIIMLAIQPLKSEASAILDTISKLEIEVNEIIGKQKLLDALDENRPRQYGGLVDELRKANERSAALVARISKFLKECAAIQIDSGKIASILEELIRNKQETEKAKASVEESDPFEALPALTSLQKSVLPQITLIGNRKFAGKKVYGEIRLFTGAEADGDRSANLKGLNMLIPEFSSFGFSANVTHSFISYSPNSSMGGKVQELDRLGLSARVGYYSKTLSIDSATYSAGVVQATLGAEVILLSKGVSFYGNLNIMKITDHINDFSDYYSLVNSGNTYDKRSTRSYYEVGIKSLLDISGEKVEGLSLKFDFGMLILNNTLRDIASSQDIAVPVIRLGLQKTIGI